MKPSLRIAEPLPSSPPPNLALWETYYERLTESYLFPNEYVVRAFLGNYPKLSMRREYKGAKVCDVGCGDGRNITLLHKLGFDIYATEATEKICSMTRKKLLDYAGIKADIREGLNTALPFDAAMFDYVLSWNACYYMLNEAGDIRQHVAEFARVMKPGAYLVASVPAPDCFSLAGAEELGNNLIRINNDSPTWSIINGSIYYRFSSFSEIEAVFGSHFHSFQTCNLSDDCFGLPLHYLIFVCQRK